MSSKELPRLKKINFSNKKHRYRLNGTRKNRYLAIDSGIRREARKTKKNKRQAATAKKARFNVLRIYRRYSNVEDCKKLTSDMRYMDKKYKLGNTKNICGKKIIKS